MSLSAVSGGPGVGADQRQLTIGYGGHGNILGQYLAKVARKIRANIIYPEEMRKRGLEGVSRIAFIITQSGEIREGSLRITKSSGYTAFDSGALKSARVSAPFEKPPKELNVSIAVAFTVETARSRATRASLP
ncbi:MAG: Gram-negative bacterial tonB protein [Syntrophorhabdus sp. PtaU1.Bin153]|nr:MAG: Gram-negative bacterial tonB protein [Syntrophorhabdus sp. PtaU1.Bin153]